MTSAPKRNVPGIYKMYAEKHPDDPALQLGWTSRPLQLLNFDMAIDLARQVGAEPMGLAVHDAGCGMGHLYERLQERGGTKSYVGTDCSEDFIATAMLNHPGVDFRRLNLLSHPAPKVDLTFAIGLCAFHNFRSIRQLLNTLWNATSSALVFNAWWNFEGYAYADEQEDIRSSIEKFRRDVERHDSALVQWLEGADYGVPTERMYVVSR